jgi:hypothetical protein
VQQDQLHGTARERIGLTFHKCVGTGEHFVEGCQRTQYTRRCGESRLRTMRLVDFAVAIAIAIAIAAAGKGKGKGTARVSRSLGGVFAAIVLIDGARKSCHCSLCRLESSDRLVMRQIVRVPSQNDRIPAILDFILTGDKKTTVNKLM